MLRFLKVGIGERVCSVLDCLSIPYEGKLGGNAPFSGGFLPYQDRLGGNAPFFVRFCPFLQEMNGYAPFF
jgi:hypothetical protein